ncbi:two-component system sensor histidine kinase [Ligilactobacillus salitolerans]|uniref:histidine kinase n=1 Tax=Ligilactobacillus salitolerans TaxID=1808352 RepID=A0A401IRR9_9LACO|nr:HAMP domain-containing sensor histidine kinase [Ligilactobacillus salitolerans]GBG94229.1 two-component system sensor histidine kinase [Ligilactobacillus salitolerans]
MKFQLTGREKSELFGEGVVTIIVLLLLNMSVFLILNQFINTNPGIENGIFQIKMSLSFGPQHLQLWSWGWVFTLLMLLADAFIVYWRLIRRYRQMQLRHVIVELHYIASGHFDHRIPFTLSGQMQRVVESVNALVDSTIRSIEEERAIERSKDELITNVSHDIRTPLTSIIGYLGLIEDKQYQSDADILKYTHTAFLKSKQMKSLVDDLFEYTKVRQVGAKLQTVKLDLQAMLEQLGASFELEAGKKQMKIHVDAGKEPLQIEADPEKLARVFNNLVANALKYGDGGKNIYLSARKISEREVQVVVANDGEPIPQSSLSQIFERFYRVEGSRSKETGGTGLGLAIAQGIVELHHGYIYARSDDQLTKFIMHFPVKHSETLKMPEKLLSKAETAQPEKKSLTD